MSTACHPPQVTPRFLLFIIFQGCTLHCLPQSVQQSLPSHFWSMSLMFDTRWCNECVTINVLHLQRKPQNPQIPLNPLVTGAAFIDSLLHSYFKPTLNFVTTHMTHTSAPLFLLSSHSLKRDFPQLKAHFTETFCFTGFFILLVLSRYWKSTHLPPSLDLLK